MDKQVINNPENIWIMGVQNRQTLKWVSRMYLMKNGAVDKLLLSFEFSNSFEGWDTEDEAVSKMKEVAEITIVE